MPVLNLLPPVMPFRWACAYGEDRIGLWQAFEVAGVRQVMRWIPLGEFLMGSPKTEKERGNSERQHHVVLTEGFWLADTTCTQALWQAVMGENPSSFKDDPQNPVEQVSWLDITDQFLPKLNALAPGLQLELPTEAQWEYACRAGTTTPFSFGQQITSDQVNYDGNFPYAGGEKGEYRIKTVPVKALPANLWGLHQMHGNVYEWCVDEYAAYPEGAVENHFFHQNKKEPRQRVIRGGCWVNDGGGCRSAFRGVGGSDVRFDFIGFRLVRRAC